MTYLELKRKLLGDETAPAGDPRSVGLAFPLGTPENLRPQLENFILCGLIEIQRYIECWQVGHIDATPGCSVMVQNGCSVITKPDGLIEEVFTVESKDGAWLYPIPYFPVELAYLRRWMSRFRREYKPEFVTPAGRDGYRAASRLNDSPLGRALSGVWTIDARTNRLIVGPWLQSNELLVVKWSGIKRTWSDTDLVSDNPDFVRLVMLWVHQEYARTWASSDLATKIDTWSGAQGDAIVECRHKMQLPMISGTANADEVAEARDYYAANPPAAPSPVKDTTVICVVGDSGTAGANALAVAAAIALDNPDLVVIAGDAVYQPNTPSQALAPYQSFIDEGRLVVSLGNHDLDVNNGADVVQFVQNPGNGRYFNVVVGPVEFFVLNDGINTAGDIVEDDGNFQGSIQSSLIESLITRSCAWWKFAVVHHPAYTSGSQYWPGVTDNRWISDLEVHGVLSAHTHAYERGTWRNRKHVIVGTGGQTLHTFTTPPISGSEVRISEFGYLRITATSKTCLLEFVSTSGAVLDSFSLTGDPPMRSSLPPETETTAFNDVIQAGATYATAFFIRDVNGAAVNLTGCTAVLQLRRSVGAPDPPDLELSTGSGITITGAEGRIDVTMTPVQTGALSGVYVYAMEVTYPNTTVERPIEGTFTISPEIVL